MSKYTENMFSAEELQEIRGKFKYVDQDIDGNERLFFDNAGGSLRLSKAEEAFHRVDNIPDASEHSNTLALKLAALEEKGRADIKNVIFNAKCGSIYPSFTASQIAMEVIRVISEHAKGTNYVTTALEHPSVFDAMTYYSSKHGCELRVAGVNKETGGVDADTILSLIDENTAVLACMAASNISGYIYENEKIFKEARKINPDIYIYCDAVQHAPHASLDPVRLGADAMSFAPYKFFGVRGFGVAWLSDRINEFDHHRLLGKAKNDWEIGSPATAQYAVITEIVNYVADLGKKDAPENADRRMLFERGMKRIADHERGLLYMMLEGVGETKGLRHMKGLKVQMDGKDLNTRDLILGVEFDHISCEKAIEEYEKRGVIAFERSASSMYSKRMVEAFDSKGMVRLSPLHVNTPEDIEKFLKITEEMASL